MRADERTSAELRKEMSDLVAVLSLPLIWRGRTSDRIGANLADILISLLRLDFIHIDARDAAGELLVDQARAADASRTAELALAVAALPSGADEVILPDGSRLRVARVSPGLQREAWNVAAASSRRNFPTAMESFLLRAAVDQASVAVETARLYEAAQDASRAKSGFIATMSHELRTPLNAILGYVDLLKLGIPDPIPPSALEHVERLSTSARHLLDLIDEVLRFSRLDAGHETAHLADVDLEQLAREVADLMRPLAVQKAIALDFTATGSLVCRTDAAKVRQILFNLVSNAVKFTERGSIEVALVREHRGARITVRDTGVGIAPEDLQHIFEPFRQVDDAFTRRSGGTGLGLSVARSLAELLGGSLHVESQPGVGTTFTLQLPIG